MHPNDIQPHTSFVVHFWTREDQELHEKVMAGARTLSPEKIFALAVHAGIYTPEGELTPPYRDDEPKKDAPTLG